MGEFHRTSRVPIGRYEVEVGAPAGTVVVARDGDGDPGALARALRAAPGFVSTLEKGTERPEDAVELITDVLNGVVIEPQRAVAHVDLLLELLQRYVGQGRRADAVRVARAVNGALAVALRWTELARSLRAALSAAERLGDKPAVAWAHHELGTLHLAAEDPSGAQPHLEQARTIRRLLGDKEALAATEQNLGYLCRQLRDLLREGRVPPRRRRVRRVLLFAAAMVLLFCVGVAAGAVIHPKHKPELIAFVEGQGSVISAPAGVDCHGGRCDASFERDQEVTLAAAARAGARFVGWSGDCEGQAACRVRLDHTRTVTARFVTKSHTRTLHVHREGDGRVTGASSAIDCGTLCTAHVERESPIRLVAKAGANAKFVGWRGPCTGKGPCEFTVHGDVNVTARFEAIKKPASQRTLTVSHEGAGSVTSTPAGIACGRQCAATFAKGRAVALKAAPADGSRFTRWSGACTGSASCSVAMDDNRAVTAHFTANVRPKPKLTTSSTDGGTISPSCPAGCSRDPGEEVTVTATPADGSYLKSWGGDCASNPADANTCTVKMSGDREVSAVFDADVE
jgi:List-Bact-rpt repeat protein